MPDLRAHLDRIAERPDVATVLLVSDEGLPIAHAGTPSDWEELAALGATLLQRARALGPATGRGGLRLLAAEFDGGLAAVIPGPDATGLIVLAAPGSNAGVLLFDLERQGDALAAMI
jgi:predicted regulator of Ras-like GTPase activity (Roadblock/LC7/MglB family)